MNWLSDTNSLIGIVSGLIAIYTAFAVWKKQQGKKKEQVESIKCPAERFLKLFESHGVSRSQISGFFGHGLSIADCSSSDKLIEKITEEILRDAAELFGINLEWLHGASEEVYKVHHFYKNPQKCIQFINTLKSTGNELSGYALRPDNSVPLDSYTSAIVILENIGQINEKPVNRLHVLGGWVHTYWRCRGYYAACASIAMNNDIWLVGKTCNNSWLTKFSSGECLPEYEFDLASFCFELSEAWYVDEFLETPRKYLQDVSPEENNFGLNSAIELWLKLESQGYMCVDKYSNKQRIRDAFLSYKI
ncbi:hypothetical protein [Thalassotalea sp. G2M2-11]|uniref:hypothetical protein n=1 Tax=Thalassotalea sp. G2M2-11 TaxID=2787627 RepID=UPI0019D24985|nr:hypothetical protein [Thalassotalea sp. G2M2-11]